MKNKICVGVAGALLVFASVGALLISDEDSSSIDEKASSAAEVQANGWSNTNPANVVFGPGLMPSSSRASGTARSTSIFDLTAEGKIILNEKARVALDVLLSNAPKAMARLETEKLQTAVSTGLSQEEASKAMRLLNNYLSLRKAEAELTAQLGPATVASPQDELAKLSALRKSYLGADVANALFGSQEQQAAFALEVQRITYDPKLSEQEKAQQMKALRDTLPPQIAASLPILEQTADALHERVAKLRGRGDSEAEVNRLRTQYLGAENAKAMSEMEAQKSSWDRRNQLFLQQRNIIINSGMSNTDKQQRIESLLREQFGEAEIAAAKAYNGL